MHVYLHTHVYTHIYTYTCSHIYTYTHICAYTYKHAHTHTYINFSYFHPQFLSVILSLAHPLFLPNVFPSDFHVLQLHVIHQVQSWLWAWIRGYLLWTQAMAAWLKMQPFLLQQPVTTPVPQWGPPSTITSWRVRCLQVWCRQSQMQWIHDSNTMSCLERSFCYT